MLAVQAAPCDVDGTKNVSCRRFQATARARACDKYLKMYYAFNYIRCALWIRRLTASHTHKLMRTHIAPCRMGCKKNKMNLYTCIIVYIRVFCVFSPTRWIASKVQILYAKCWQPRNKSHCLFILVPSRGTHACRLWKHNKPKGIQIWLQKLGLGVCVCVCTNRAA